jgi:predicted O-methyltransferase YrrM
LFDGVDPELLGVFWQAMHSLSTFTARALGQAVDFTGFKRLLDVGGGSGAFDIELCRQYPHLRATVYDLAHVAEIAARNAAEAGLSDRVGTVAGDFFGAPALPNGHDVILLSMILHDWNEEKNLEILRKCFAALPSGGSLIVSELLVNDEKTGPVPAALMSLNMLIETEGRNYTSAEYAGWMTGVGFSDIRTVWFESAGANGVVIGRKP